MLARTVFRRLIVATAAAGVVGLVAAPVAAPGSVSQGVIEPSTRVKGMLVVQGPAQRTETRLLGLFCDPVVLRPGRRTRACGLIPRTTRLYVGYGSFEPQAKIDAAWKATTWDMWIDGERVDLSAFGTTDRWLVNYPPAGGKDVVLREWSITLIRATPGRHSIRYRARGPDGVTDTTWTFRVAAE